MPRNLAILLFDDVEVLDFAGPFEVFSTSRDHNDGQTALVVLEFTMLTLPLVISVVLPVAAFAAAEEMFSDRGPAAFRAYIGA